MLVLAVVGPLFALAALWEPGASSTRDVDPRNARAFIQDNLWTADDAQYGVWVAADSAPVLGRRTEGESWTITELGELVGNPLAAPTIDDEHNVFAVAVDALGHVHVAGNMHADPLRYIRTARPGDLDDWVQPAIDGPNEHVTYPMFVALPDDTLLFLRREGFPAHGRILLDRLSPDATEWEHQGTIIDGAATDEGAYLQRVAVDPATGEIHLAWVWRGGTSGRDNSDISYMRSGDGGRSWTTSGGEELVLPVTHPAAEVVVAAGSADPAPLNSGGMVTDGSGQPHFVVRRGNAILHLRFDGQDWIEDEPLDSFSGRPGLVRGRDGSVWAVGTRGRRLRAEQLHPVVGPAVDGPPVSATFEATADTQLMATDGRIEILLPVRGDDEPTVATFDLP